MRLYAGDEDDVEVAVLVGDHRQAFAPIQCNVLVDFCTSSYGNVLPDKGQGLHGAGQ
jgi:hypothetical protein